VNLFSAYLPFMLFAFVASITPGPTNILILASSQRFGVKATLPAVAGGLSGGEPDCVYLRRGGRRGAAGASAGAYGDELDGGAVAKLDELATVPCTGGAV